MGQDIGWHRITGRSSTGGWDTKWADDAPEEFSQRFQNRWEFFNAVMDAPSEHITTCGCCQNGYTYGCGYSSVLKPTDIPALRKICEERGLFEPSEYEKEEGLEPICKRMVDWLEQHSDVVLDYG
jgi:hypothetical protein